MKRVISLILIICLIAVFITGCSEDKSTDELSKIEGLSNPAAMDVKYAKGLVLIILTADMLRYMLMTGEIIL